MYVNRAGQTIDVIDGNAQAFAYPSGSIKGYFGFQSYAYENLVVLQYYNSNADTFEVIQTANSLPQGKCEIIYGFDKNSQKPVFFICEPGKSFLTAKFVIRPTTVTSINPYDVDIIASMVVQVVENDSINFTIRNIDAGSMQGQTFVLDNTGSNLTVTDPSYDNIHTSYAIVSLNNSAVDMLHTNLRQDINKLLSDTTSKFISR